VSALFEDDDQRKLKYKSRSGHKRGKAMKKTLLLCKIRKKAQLMLTLKTRLQRSLK
jgi:hypothetical protein